MDLVHCIYCSASAEKRLSSRELEALLEQCRRNNAKSGITGILLYHDGAFFQVLEGDRPVVEALFAKIARDDRHTRATTIVLESIEERTFGAWTMGYPNLSAKDLAQIAGLNDFFTGGRSYMELGAGRAKTLLAAFKEGRWRASLG